MWAVAWGGTADGGARAGVDLKRESTDGAPEASFAEDVPECLDGVADLGLEM